MIRIIVVALVVLALLVTLFGADGARSPRRPDINAGSNERSGAQEAKLFLGAWTGSLRVAGAALDITITLRLDENSELQGTIDIPAQGAEGIPLGKFGIDGRKISFVIAAPGVQGDPIFKGELDETGNKIAGTFSQSGFEGTFSIEKK